MDDVGLLVSDKSIGFPQTNAFGDTYFSNLNGNTFNKVGASTLYEAEFSKSLFETTRLYVIVGTDSGLLPRYVQAQGIPNGSRYIFIEPSSVLKELEDAGVFEGFGDCFSFVQEETWLEALEHFKVTNYFYIQGVSSHTAFCAQEDAMELYAELSWYVAEFLQQLYYQRMSSLACQSFIIEQLYNLADNTRSSLVLKNSFKGKTAFVLGGGPSLDDVLPWLLEHRSYVVIIAVSRIVKRLLACGLEPDFICSVDPQPGNWDVSKEIFSFSQKSVFIHSFHVYHELASQWPGRSFYLGNRVPWESSLNEPTISGAGPTVTNTAIQLAVELGFSSVYLAGVDYCYTLDGFTHAQGSAESAAGARFNLTGLLVETYQGVMAPTGLDYSWARDALSIQIKHYADSFETRFYNTAFMAAKVDGVDYCSLASIELDKSPIDVGSVLNLCIPKGNVFAVLKNTLKELVWVVHQLKEIKNIAHEAYKLNETLYNASGFIENHKDKRHLDKLEGLLNRKYRNLGRLVKIFGIQKFLQITKPFDDFDSFTAEDLKTSLRVYYQSYIDGASRLIALIEKANQKLIARAEEHKEHPDWDLLIEGCYKEKNYGRVRIWRQLESAKGLSPAQENAFVELERLFAEDLGKEHTQYSEKVKRKSTLIILKSRARILFKHKQKELLSHLLLALDKHYDPEGVIPYRYLIQGYLAELDENPNEALEAYQQVLDLGAGPLEEALLRIVDLNLHSGSNGELARQALECLAQLNPRYSLFYAESCRIGGAILEAIDVYLMYIETYPQDILAQLKLAQLYINQNIDEGAELMLNHILENNPNQKSALALKNKLQERRSKT